jgi:hypothetical protein
VPVIPDPVQPEPEPVQESGGSSGGIIAIALMLLAAAGLGGWVLYRRWKRLRQEEYIFGGAPLYTQRDGPSEPTSIDAPPATLRLDSGETLEIEGIATLGVDEEATHRLPLSRAEFGNADVRLSFSGQRYVIRDLSPRTRMRINGRVASWAFLSDGDEIDIRGVKMRFHISSGVAPASES